MNISFLSVLVFYLPSDSGEKLTLGIFQESKVQTFLRFKFYSKELLIKRLYKIHQSIICYKANDPETASDDLSDELVSI